MSMPLAERPADRNAEVCGQLAVSLADTAVVTAKAQTYHWNVTGMSFGQLHELFQEIYEDHFKAQDDLAERIKALDGHVDGRPSQFLRLSAIRERDGSGSAVDMLRDLAADQDILSGSLQKLAEIAEDHGDMITNDMAIARATVHEKFAWMLRAHLRG